MDLIELVTLLKAIPATAKDVVIYPAAPDTLFFSLTAGAMPPSDKVWGKARDKAASEGLERFKIIFARPGAVA